MPARDPGALRIALVAEAPGAEEVAMGYPFAGKSGWFLNQWLAQCGVSRAQCFVGNVSQCRPSPTSNDFNLLEWNGPEVQAGIATLRDDLARFRPNVVVALGNAALHLFRHGNVAPPKSAKLGLFQWPSRVGTWRGSLFRASRSFDPLEAAALREVGARGSLSAAGCGAFLPDALSHKSPCPGPAAESSASPASTLSTNPPSALLPDASPLTPAALPPTQPARYEQPGAGGSAALSPFGAAMGGSLSSAGASPLGFRSVEKLGTSAPVSVEPHAASRNEMGRTLDGRDAEGGPSSIAGSSPAAATLARGACAPSSAAGDAPLSAAVGHVAEEAPAAPFQAANAAFTCSSLDTARTERSSATESERQSRGASASSCLDSNLTYKVIATYHPAATFRDPSFTYPLVNDLKRAVSEARSPELHLPERNIRWDLSIDEIEAACEHIRRERFTVGHDIEGGLGGLQCASFALTAHSAFVVDLMERSWDYSRRIAAITSVLEDPNVTKVLWNAAYERAIWEAVASVTLCNYEDGMLAWWERFSELPKGLDFVASILTREPYWAEGIGWDKKTGAPRVTGERFYTYNGIDSCVTLEIWQHPLVRAIADSRTPVAFSTQ